MAKLSSLKPNFEAKFGLKTGSVLHVSIEEIMPNVSEAGLQVTREAQDHAGVVQNGGKHSYHGQDDTGQDWMFRLPDTAIASENARSVIETVFDRIWADRGEPVQTVDDLGDPLDFGGARPTSHGGGKGKGKATTDSGTAGTTDNSTDTGGTTSGTSSGTSSEPALTPTQNYVSGLDTPYGFNIELVFSGTWTDALKQLVYDAAEYLSNVIIGDLPNISTSTGTIDDMRISISLTTIDGTGGYVGWGGYTTLRSDTKLPSSGYVKMDTADANSLVSKGIFDDIMLHEMLHSLGFGTAWSSMGLVKDFSGDLRFTGDLATQAYNYLYPTKAATDPLADFGVPVETDGGSGTAGVHWDEATFGSEMMTGYLGSTNKLTDLSIAALQDMGYETYVSDHIFIS